MSTKPTLADRVIRETLRPHTFLKKLTDRPIAEMRQVMLGARKFVLDDKMSSFLADLQQVPFFCADVRRPGVLDTMRHGAMLPHPKTWIEFNGRAFRKRLLENNPDVKDPWGNPPKAGPDDVPGTWGWLLEEHPRMPSVISLTEFIHTDDSGEDEVLMLPFECVWNTRDESLPWMEADKIAGMLAHGVTGYVCPHIAVRMLRPLKKFEEMEIKDGDDENKTIAVTHYLVGEMSGMIRYALALLSSLNDIPVIKEEVRPSKGYIARGSYKKFVEHTTIHLNIPDRRDTHRMARRIFAATRRRMHKVRGHWRNYLRTRTEDYICPGNTHVWGPLDEENHESCSRCGAFRTWIKEHDRGDASLGVVTHDYSVTHEIEKRRKR